jgi:hypothetical protein
MRTPTTLTVKLSQSQLRDSAMRSCGLSPRTLALKPGTRVERNRKALSARGHVKHKGQAWM